MSPRGAERLRCDRELEPWCAWLRGEALFWAGDHRGAAAEMKAARELDPSGPVARRALVREGEALLAMGEIHRAISLLRPALKTSREPGLALLLGDALQAERLEAEARQAWRRAYLASADHPASALAGRRLEAAGALGAEELIDRCELLTRAGLSEAGLDAARLAQTRARSPAARSEATLCVGRALAKLKRHPEAEAAFDGVAKEGPAPALRARAALELARSALARDDFAAAAARFEAFGQEHPTDASAAEAAFLWAWSSFNARDYPTCAARFARFVAAHRTSDRAEDGLWYAGWCSRLAGDLAAAESAFDELERIQGKLMAQAAYWRGRGAQDPKVAEACYRRAIRSAPTGWYGWMARRRLDELGTRPEPLALTAAPAPAVEPTSERERRAGRLAALGLRREAREELEESARGQTSPQDARRAAALEASLEMTDLAYRLASARLARPAFSGTDPEALGLLYPRPYATDVRAASQASGLDPSFAWAIMRRESAFDPFAVSSARAFGLMQLLVSTAEQIAKGSNELAPVADDLFVPAHNVRLAVRYLADLNRHFGSAALAAGAYNGGADAVERWVKELEKTPLDELVEQIPYKETRHYVKGVLGDYFTYRAIWNAQEPALPFSLEPPAAPAPVASP